MEKTVVALARPSLIMSVGLSLHHAVVSDSISHTWVLSVSRLSSMMLFLPMMYCRMQATFLAVPGRGNPTFNHDAVRGSHLFHTHFNMQAVFGAAVGRERTSHWHFKLPTSAFEAQHCSCQSSTASSLQYVSSFSCWCRKRVQMREWVRCGSSCLHQPLQEQCSSCWQAAGKWLALEATLQAWLQSGCCNGNSAMRCCKPSGDFPPAACCVGLKCMGNSKMGAWRSDQQAAGKLLELESLCSPCCN